MNATTMLKIGLRTIPARARRIITTILDQIAALLKNGICARTQGVSFIHSFLFHSYSLFVSLVPVSAASLSLFPICFARTSWFSYYCFVILQAFGTPALLRGMATAAAPRIKTFKIYRWVRSYLYFSGFSLANVISL